jgi:site-specific recombinase XerD
MIGANPLTREQMKGVLKATTSIRERALLALGFTTGYRISELLSLTVADVSTNGVIHNHINVKAAASKTKVGRTVLLNSDAKKALAKLIEWLSAKGLDNTTALFVSRKHVNGYAAITRQQAGRLIKGLFALVGAIGSSYSTHSMRKTFAKTVYDFTGGKIELVQIALGHKSINSTVSYLSFNTSSIDDAIHAMEF